MLSFSVHDAIERFAKNSKLFALLDAPGIDRLAAAGTTHHFEPGVEVVCQGDHGDSFYLIAEGQVRVLVEDEFEPLKKQEVAQLQAGMFFGEIGVVTRQPRTATVETTESSELIRFKREPVMALLKDYPKILEIVGGVGLQRSEENLQRMLGADDEILLEPASELESNERPLSGDLGDLELPPEIASGEIPKTQPVPTQVPGSDGLSEEDLFSDID